MKSRTKLRSTIQNVKRSDGQLTSSEEKTANEFNSYFSSVFSSDSSGTPEIVEEVANTISEIEFSRDKVFELLNKIKILHLVQMIFTPKFCMKFDMRF